MDSPAVSVIIPCYNAEKYLDMCMESILNQTLRDIEIICVDDGSTDKTLNKLNYYAANNPRMRVFSQRNQFAGAARNLGLSQARGEYVLFLDCDDFFAENLAQDAYAAAVSAASSASTPVIPPGVNLVVYALIAQASLGRVFAAAVLGLISLKKISK